MGTSSDDSLDSTASYATVKSVDTGAPPALPPKSPIRTAPKPPTITPRQVMIVVKPNFQL